MAVSNGNTVAVQGLAQLQRDLYKVNTDARREVREGLREVGQIVADQAKVLASSRMHTRTGDLVRKIVPTVRAQGVYVQAKATHRGFAYPGKFEFGGSNTRRAFLLPALEQKRPEVDRKMEEWLDSFLSKNNL